MVNHARLQSAIRSLQYARNYTSGHEESASISRAIGILRETHEAYGDLMDAIEAGYVNAAYDLLDRALEMQQPAESVA